MWVIQRRAPTEPVAYWGRSERWIARPPRTRFAQLLAPSIPEGAMRFERHAVAFDVAEYLRKDADLQYGVEIAVMSEPAPEQRPAPETRA